MHEVINGKKKHGYGTHTSTGGNANDRQIGDNEIK
jgi:hypothetical protein